MKAIHEGAVYIVSQDNQIRAVILDNGSNAVKGILPDLLRAGVARVNYKESLNRRILEFVDFRIGVLPIIFRVSFDLDGHQSEVINVRNFEVGSEDRRTQRDLIPLAEQLVFNKGIKAITHSCSTAFSGEEVVDTRRDLAVTQRLYEKVAHNLLNVHEHSFGSRVIISDRAAHQFEHPGVRIKAKGFNPIGDGIVQEGDARCVCMAMDVLFKPLGDASLARHVLPACGKSNRRFDSSMANWPSVKNAWRGVAQIQLGLPRPAFNTVSSVCLLASSMSLFLTSKGLSCSYSFNDLIVIFILSSPVNRTRNTGRFSFVEA